MFFFRRLYTDVRKLRVAFVYFESCNELDFFFVFYYTERIGSEVESLSDVSKCVNAPKNCIKVSVEFSRCYETFKVSLRIII